MHPIGVVPDISSLWCQQYTAGAGNIQHVAVRELMEFSLWQCMKKVNKKVGKKVRELL